MQLPCTLTCFAKHSRCYITHRPIRSLPDLWPHPPGQRAGTPQRSGGQRAAASPALSLLLLLPSTWLLRHRRCSAPRAWRAVRCCACACGKKWNATLQRRRHGGAGRGLESAAAALLPLGIAACATKDTRLGVSGPSKAKMQCGVRRELCCCLIVLCALCRQCAEKRIQHCSTDSGISKTVDDLR